MANELYAELGVAPETDPGDLRKAYFRLLRQHTAEQAPARHQSIRRAYETLGDAEKRRAYDALQVGGGQVGAMMEKGLGLMEEEDWAEAERAFKRALALSPDHLPARIQLARAVAQGGNRPRAVELLQQGARSSGAGSPDLWSEMGWIALGEVVSATGNEPKKMGAAHKKLILAATEAFDQLIALQPKGRGGYLGRARVSYYLENWPETRSWARRSASCDGTLDFEDFEALRLVFEVHLLEGNPAEAVKVMHEIRAVTPDQPEVRAYAAEGFASFGSKLMEAQAFGPAAEVFTACLAFNPGDADLARLAETNLHAARAHQEWRAARDDSRLLRPFVGLCAWAVGSYTGELDKDESKQLVDAFFANISDLPPTQVATNLRHIKSKYPNVWRCQDKILDELLANVQKLTTSVAARSDGTVAESGCGCLVLLGLLGLGAVAGTLVACAF